MSKWDDFKPDPKNANRGTKRGAALLRGSFRRNKAGRSAVAAGDGTILAGNKSAEAAKEAGIEPLVVETEGDQFVIVRRRDIPDADDPRARDLAYADNRVGEVNLNWDLDQLKEDWNAGIALDEHWNEHELELIVEEFAAAQEAEDFDDVNPYLEGAHALKMGMSFPSDEPYGIPPLLPEMLAEKPEELRTWAGADAEPNDDYGGLYLYNYGSDSIRGLDLTRAIMCFYVDDYRFENWFTAPDLYVGRMLNAGMTMAVSPNFSLWASWAKALSIYSAYRARWLGRYMQEAGVRVIPDVNWADADTFDFCFAGIPKNAPCLIVQIQTYEKNNVVTDQRAAAGFVEMLDVLTPEALLVYGGSLERRALYAALMPDELDVTWLDSRAQVRQDRVMSKGVDKRYTGDNKR